MSEIKVVSPIEIYHKKTLTPFSIKPHLHNAHEIIFIAKGEVSFQISGKKYTAHENTLIFINSFENHKTTVTKFPYERYFLFLSSEFIQSSIKDLTLLSIINQRPEDFSHMITVDSKVGEHLIRLLNLMVNEHQGKEAFSIDAIGNYLHLLLIHLFRHHNTEFPYRTSSRPLFLVNQVQKHIEENYSENITLTDVAKQFNIDMYYLSHTFKKMSGYTFKQYLIAQRLSKAKELLLTTPKSVTEVCMCCGFNNVSHFIRLFKKNEGLSPLKYKLNKSNTF